MCIYFVDLVVSVLCASGSPSLGVSALQINFFFFFLSFFTLLHSAASPRRYSNKASPHLSGEFSLTFKTLSVFIGMRSTQSLTNLPVLPLRRKDERHNDERRKCRVVLNCLSLVSCPATHLTTGCFELSQSGVMSSHSLNYGLF